MERREAERREAISGAQAIYHQAASLSGLEVMPDSAALIGELAGEGFYRVEERRRPEAVANLEAAPIGGQLFAHENSQRDCTAF